MAEMNSISGIGYEGIVTITVKENDKVVYTQKQHNIGGLKLFNTLVKTLAGSYNNKTELPSKIMLFYKSDENLNAWRTGAKYSPYSNKNGVGTSGQRSIFCSTNDTVNIGYQISEKTVGSSNLNYAYSYIKYHFLVPTSALTMSGAQDKFNMVGLFNTNDTITDTEQENFNFLAFFYIVGDDGKLKDIELDIDKNAVVIIDWELRVGNAEVAQ